MAFARSLATITTIAASTVVFAGCASSDDVESTTTSDAAAAAAESASEPQTVTYTWDRNIAGEDEDPEFEETSVEVPVNPETIVVFDIASLDTIGALGGEIAGAPLDFVPDYLSGYLADDAFNAGTLFEADLLEIEAQQPDLIVIGGRSAALYDDLTAIAPTIDTSMAGSFEDTLEKSATFFGEVLGAEDEADAVLADLEAGIAEVRAATADAGTGLGLMVSGGSLSAMSPAGEGANTPAVRGGLIYDVFGVTPVVDDIASATHGEPVSFEFLLENDPDYLYVVDRDAAVGEEDAQAAAAVLDNDIVHETTASQEDQIIYLDPTPWYIIFGGLDTTQLMIDDMMQITE